MRYSTSLEINLNLLAENYKSIQSLAPNASILPMVKADAYGNGIIPITRFLNEELKVQKLGCATLGEALEVCRELPHLRAELLVFSETDLYSPEARSAYSNYNIVPVLHKKSDLEIVLNDSLMSKIPLILKVNTGMNRLGLSFEDLEQFVPQLRNRGVRHLMTHFSCSYYVMKSGDKTNRQYAEFLRIKKFLQDQGIEIQETSVSNSGAIEQSFGVDETFVRPGLMLYGPPSVEPRIWKGHQISKLSTKVLKTFIAKKGTPVGYGVHVTGEESLVVVLPIGYGDGLLTYMSGINLNINGFSAKVFGRINMDMIFLSFDPSVEGKIKENDVVEIWGHDNSTIASIASQMKTHPYQVMCAISPRIPKIYKVK
jgi:alanine racemase